MGCHLYPTSYKFLHTKITGVVKLVLLDKRFRILLLPFTTIALLLSFEVLCLVVFQLLKFMLESGFSNGASDDVLCFGIRLGLLIEICRDNGEDCYKAIIGL